MHVHHIVDGLRRAQSLNLHLLRREGLEAHYKVSISCKLSFP